MKWIWPTQPNNTPLLDWLFKSRNIIDSEKFLNPSVNDLHDPLLMYGMKEAAEAIIKAIKDKKKIFIHGDFDVDGITATTIMWSYLYRQCGANITPFIPSRFDEGYGLSEKSIENLIEQGAQLIISVDCGVKDLEIVTKYKDKVDFIITDHHTLLPSEGNPKSEILNPKQNDKFKIQNSTNYKLQTTNSKKVGNHLVSADALAVVHPQLSNQYPFTQISGAVVSWKVCCAINQLLKKDFDMLNYVDLAALGTVCDVMPLIDENRAIVSLGIQKMQQKNNLGIVSLLEVANVDPKQTSAYHLGFVLGPRLNASGRLESALDAVRLLSTNSDQNAFKIANYLHELNTTRQDLTKKFIDIAEEQIEKQKNNKIYFVHGEEWPEGIVGLIAGKLTQKYNRPVLAASQNGEIIKGSARSIAAMNIAEVLKSLDPHLERHGGHAGAAGFTLNSSALSAFLDALNSSAESILKEEDLLPSLNIDAEGDLSAIDSNLINQILKLEPFGHGNESPLIGFKNVQIVNPSAIGTDKKHMKFTASNKNSYISAIAFGKGNEYSTLFNSNSSSGFDVAGYLELNEWNGNVNPQIRVREVRKSEESLSNLVSKINPTNKPDADLNNTDPIGKEVW